MFVYLETFQNVDWNGIPDKGSGWVKYEYGDSSHSMTYRGDYVEIVPQIPPETSVITVIAR